MLVWLIVEIVWWGGVLSGDYGMWRGWNLWGGEVGVWVWEL